MKKLTTIAALLMAAMAAAAEVVTWDPNPADEAVTAYKVYWSTNATTPRPWPVLATVSASGPLSATNPGARAFYYVTAINAYAESYPSDTAFRPLQISGLKFTGGALSWTPSPSADLVTGYKVYSSATSNGTFTLEATVASPSYTPTNKVVYITAVNPYGESDPSNTAIRPGNPQKPQVK